jgi:predicted Rossmann fold flavoprotein
LKNSTGKAVFSDFGEMLFTHTGVSGPVVLSASRHFKKENGAGMILAVDLKPALTNEVLDARILRDFTKYANKDYRNALDDLLPRSLVPVIVDLSAIDPVKNVNQITKEERIRLVGLLKNLEVPISGTAGMDEAIVTAGGVKTSEIEPSMMESKIVGGLYFAGEIMDLDGYTGGYNLTIAFCTGRCAGHAVRRE